MRKLELKNRSFSALPMDRAASLHLRTRLPKGSDGYIEVGYFPKEKSAKF
jgi:hypothetical protein